MKVLLRNVWVAALVVLVAFGLVGGCVGEARRFQIDAIDVDAQVMLDGSMLVTEQVTYTFSGADDDPFTVASRDFQPGPHDWTISSIEAFEDGEALRTVLWTGQLFEWDIAPATGTKTYELRYRVERAVQVWSDTAELYWNWIGTTSPSVGSWSAVVRLPQEHDGEVRAWAHGPLQGEVRVHPDRIVSFTDDVPGGQHVDNRVLMPTDWFTLTPRPTERLDEILAEEAEWAADANRRRADAERAENLRRTARDILTVLMGPLIIAAGAAFYLVWRRWGKDPDRPDDIGDYWREVPDDPPAVGTALLGWGRVDADAYAATVMDLARRGHLRIEEIEVERRLRKPRSSYRFVKTDTSETSVKRFERRLLSWLFPSGTTVVTQDELIDRAKKDPTRANKFWTGFQKDVKEELDRRRYLVRGTGIAFALHAVIVVVLAAAAIAAIVLGALVPGLVGLGAALVLAPLGILHRARTPAGTRRDTEWRGLRRYLADFSRLDEAPVGHLALWEHYLVAATALGVAEELLDGLRTKFPELADDQSGFAPWYRPSSSNAMMGAGLSQFGSSFGRSSVSSFAPPSSSSGGGGGFSSGGGGGGGGGGFGAR